MTWEEAVRRIAAGEPVENVLDEKSLADEAEFRAFIAAEGRPDILAQYDQRMKAIRLGISQAQSVWHSISDKQRSVLRAISTTRTGKIVRRSTKPSVYVLNGKAELLCRAGTIRALAAHDLLAWDGGAFDPEQAAVITERGTFTVAHGDDEPNPWKRSPVCPTT